MSERTMERRKLINPDNHFTTDWNWLKGATAGPRGCALFSSSSAVCSQPLCSKIHTYKAYDKVLGKKWSSIGIKSSNNNYPLFWDLVKSHISDKWKFSSKSFKFILFLFGKSVAAEPRLTYFFRLLLFTKNKLIVNFRRNFRVAHVTLFFENVGYFNPSRRSNQFLWYSWSSFCWRCRFLYERRG